MDLSLLEVRAFCQDPVKGSVINLKLKELGVDGAVLGQAIYTGAVDLAEAVSAIQAHS